MYVWEYMPDMEDINEIKDIVMRSFRFYHQNLKIPEYGLMGHFINSINDVKFPPNSRVMFNSPGYNVSGKIGTVVYKLGNEYEVEFDGFPTSVNCQEKDLSNIFPTKKISTATISKKTKVVRVCNKELELYGWIGTIIDRVDDIYEIQFVDKKEILNVKDIEHVSKNKDFRIGDLVCIDKNHPDENCLGIIFKDKSRKNKNAYIIDFGEKKIMYPKTHFRKVMRKEDVLYYQNKEGNENDNITRNIEE